MAPVHGYWSLRGLGQSIRLLLAHAGVDYEDKRYNIKGEAPNWDRSEWLTDKFSLGLDFPNNPYYIDGDVKLTQSMTIMKYLGRKYDLAPVTEGEHQRVDLIEAEAIDMRGAWGRTCYNPDFENLRDDFVKSFIEKCKQLSAFLGNHKFVAGEKLTYVDFVLYEILDVHLIMEPKALEGLDNLVAYHQRIASLEKVAAYIKSDKFIASPLNGPMANFGGK